MPQTRTPQFFAGHGTLSCSQVSTDSTDACRQLHEEAEGLHGGSLRNDGEHHIFFPKSSILVNGVTDTRSFPQKIPISKVLTLLMLRPKQEQSHGLLLGVVRLYKGTMYWPALLI